EGHHRARRVLPRLPPGSDRRRKALTRRGASPPSTVVARLTARSSLHPPDQGLRRQTGARTWTIHGDERRVRPTLGRGGLLLLAEEAVGAGGGLGVGAADGRGLAAQDDRELVVAVVAGIGVEDAHPESVELLAELLQRRAAGAMLARRRGRRLAGGGQRDQPGVVGRRVVLLQLDLHVRRIGQRLAGQTQREEAGRERAQRDA